MDYNGKEATGGGISILVNSKHDFKPINDLEQTFQYIAGAVFSKVKLEGVKRFKN